MYNSNFYTNHDEILFTFNYRTVASDQKWQLILEASEILAFCKQQFQVIFKNHALFPYD